MECHGFSAISLKGKWTAGCYILGKTHAKDPDWVGLIPLPVVLEEFEGLVLRFSGYFQTQVLIRWVIKSRLYLLS